MYQGNKIVVVLPAYNASATLKQTVDDLPEMVDRIILVDDKSQDDTLSLAKSLGLLVYSHSENKGYGANQKTCYSAALKEGADIIVMIHPDYQYDPRLVKHFVEFMVEGYFDVMLGTRIRSRKEALNGGMPMYKYISNRFLSLVQNLVSGKNLSEWHTGMRAYKRSVLTSINWQKHSDDFIFDSQMLFSISAYGYKIGEIPVPVRYFKEASSINFWRSLKYGLQTLVLAFAYLFRSRKKQ